MTNPENEVQELKDQEQQVMTEAELDELFGDEQEQEKAPTAAPEVTLQKQRTWGPPKEEQETDVADVVSEEELDELFEEQPDTPAETAPAESSEVTLQKQRTWGEEDEESE